MSQLCALAPGESGRVSLRSDASHVTQARRAKSSDDVEEEKVIITHLPLRCVMIHQIWTIKPAVFAPKLSCPIKLFGYSDPTRGFTVCSSETSDMSSQLFLLTVVSAMVSSQIAADKLQDRPNLTCLSSSDPAAVNATLLHGNHNDEGALWSRTSAPLPRCSSSSFSPPPSHCEVCLLQEEVYIICDNLPAGAVLHLERPGSAISTKESDCPILPPAGDSHPGKIIVADENRGHYGAVASPILCVLILILTGLVLRKLH
ncbi:uncharacterized protein LOC110366607 isoform X2 [Fundulus heteroclitus]|uniref:uncharacterized protein LOC110366607 isoform X2 n=1 Tax=Fundulus heteroclitus TaxID=8078 RepID=UPI00165CC250|nr:uncharacterized protein LOC110366607 isoform X2 [Fundulus heteroclitus]